VPVLASLTDISRFPYCFQFTRAARLKTVNRAFTSNHGSQLALVPANPNIDDCCFVVWSLRSW
jgi:hypothetical protein